MRKRTLRGFWTIFWLESICQHLASEYLSFPQFLGSFAWLTKSGLESLTTHIDVLEEWILRAVIHFNWAVQCNSVWWSIILEGANPLYWREGGFTVWQPRQHRPHTSTVCIDLLVKILHKPLHSISLDRQGRQYRGVMYWLLTEADVGLNGLLLGET